MNLPQQEPGTCNTCWHLPPTGNCKACGEHICPHCRHDKLTDMHDGCASDLPKPEVEVDPADIDPDDTPDARADFLRAHAPEV